MRGGVRVVQVEPIAGLRGGQPVQRDVGSHAVLGELGRTEYGPGGGEHFLRTARRQRAAGRILAERSGHGAGDEVSEFGQP